MTARLLMIGLDAADGRLLDAWCGDGTMPHLAALRVRGAVKRLTAPAGATDDAVWASFQYGTGLGIHGRYSYLIPLSTGKLGMAVTEEGNYTPFWRTPGTEDLRTAVLDIPKCAAPKPFNGIHLLDWLVHGRSFPEPLSYPECLAGEVVGRFGAAPPSRCSYHLPDLTDEEAADITANLQKAVSMKRAAGVHYLSAEPWDLFMIAFKEAHCAEHGLWDFIDPDHVSHRPGQNERVGEPIRRIFKDLDSAVGDLVAAAGPGAEVVVFSTSDFASNGTIAHLMPQIITRLNGRRPKRALRRLLGLNTRPYALLPSSDNAAGVRINASPGSRRHRRLLARVEKRLGELVDGDTGQPVVVRVSHPSIEEAGPRAATLPDLLAHYRANATPRVVTSARLGRFTGGSPRIRPGNHVAGGRVIAAGAVVAEAIDSVATFSDFGPFALRVLRDSRLPIHGISRD